MPKFKWLLAATLAAVVSAFMSTVVFLLWSPDRNALAYHIHAYWLDADGRRENYKWIAPPPTFTGTWRTWDRKWRLQAVEQYLDGKMNGEVTYFCDSGAKSQQLALAKGVDHGANLFWDEQGQLRTVEVNDNGQRLLRIVLWPSGALKEVCPYNQQGQKHGAVQRWNELGILVSIEEWRNGIRAASGSDPQIPPVGDTDE